MRNASSSLCLLVALMMSSNGFVVNHHPRVSISVLMVTMPDVSEMRVADIRQELESRGISTKTFLEKRDLVEALKQARKGEKTPTVSPTTTASSSWWSPRRTAKEDSQSGRREVKEDPLPTKGGAKERPQPRTYRYAEPSEFVKPFAAEAVVGVDGTPRREAKAGPRAPTSNAKDIPEAGRQEKTPTAAPATTTNSSWGRFFSRTAKEDPQSSRREVTEDPPPSKVGPKEGAQPGRKAYRYAEPSDFVKPFAAEAVVGGGTANAKTTNSAGSRIRDEPQSARREVKQDPSPSMGGPQEGLQPGANTYRYTEPDGVSARTKDTGPMGNVPKHPKHEPEPSGRGVWEKPQSTNRVVREYPLPNTHRYAEPDGVSARTKSTGPMGNVPKHPKYESQPYGSGVWEESKSDSNGVTDVTQPVRSVWEEPYSASRGVSQDPQPNTITAQEEPFDPSYREVVMQKYDPTNIIE